MTEKVEVVATFGRTPKDVMPRRRRWQGRQYDIRQLGMHHMVREGRAVHHVFSVTDGTTFFRLDLDAETLLWTLREVSDGLAD